MLQPFELLGAEIAQTAGFEIEGIDQSDEMHAVGVEAVPAVTLGGPAVTFLIDFAIGIDEVVFAGHVMHVEPRLRNDVIGVVEFLFLRQVGDVAGVDHEGRLLRQGVDLFDRLFQRAERVGIGRLVKPDVAVADLQERQSARVGRLCLAHDAERVRHAARDCPQDAGAAPGHAFQHLAAADAVPMIEFTHCESPFQPPVPRRYGFAATESKIGRK